MDKPLMLKIADFEKDLVSLIEKAQLPAFILKYPIEKIYNQLVKIEADELQKTLEEYEASKKEKNTKNK